MTVFTRRSLAPETAAVREAYAPDCLVLDVDADFETLPPEAAEELGLFVDALDLAAYPTDWLPADAPTPLTRYAGTDFTIGMPGDVPLVPARGGVRPDRCRCPRTVPPVLRGVVRGVGRGDASQPE